MTAANPQEWTFFQRLKYSLGAKVFRRVFAFTLILSFYAAGIGLALYTGAVTGEYARTTFHAAKIVWNTIDREAALRYIDSIFELYNRKIPPTSNPITTDFEGKPYYDPDYLREAASYCDEQYYEIQDYMKKICQSSDVDSLSIAVFDRANSRMLTVIESDLEYEPMVAGAYSEFRREDVIDVAANESTNRFLIMPSDRFNLVVSSSYVIRNDRDYVYAVFCDVEIGRILVEACQFMLFYIMILMIVSLIVTLTFVWYMNRQVVKPIDKLTNAAGSYTHDRETGNMSQGHFRQIGIRTGDEIENLANVLDGMEMEISEYYEHLMESFRQQQRLNSEMEIAERIQQGTLPSIFPPFPDYTSVFDIYALMDPAKEVGGDFYDFFFLNDDQLVFLIADVSGKGIPGALFMMISKIMLYNNSKMIGPDPALILEAVNSNINVSNPAEMFVTVWLGILDLKTGKLVAANAGHEYPFIQKAGGQFELLKDKHGFVIGGMDEFKYKNYEIQMEPGDAIFVYTDGAPEALNTGDEMFGTERIGEALNRDPERNMKDLLNDVKNSVNVFSEGTEQFDDITMLGLRYHGDTDMHEMTIEATLESIPEVTAFVDRKLEQVSCPVKAIKQINIAIDELFSNIAHYAYKPETGPATVRVEVEKDPMTVVITFIDNGRPYDPLSNGDPDVSLSAEEREVGGLGIFLVRKMMDEVTYEYKDGKNILRVRQVIKNN